MEYIILSTTSKHAKEFLKLPSRKIKNRYCSNYLISHRKTLFKFLKSVDEKKNIIIADCEKKQNISIYDELIDSNFKVLDYKPNDLTMEAADLTLMNFFNKNISSKSIAVYGTGNIAFKIALRLSERNVHVHVYGRDKKKVLLCVETLKQVTFDRNLIHEGDYKSKVDSLISFVSADRVINDKALNILKENSLCLDGGIGNFSKEFIKSALEQGHEVRRLDVRQSQEIMDGYINSRLNSEFNQIIGRDIIKNCSVIAGGIMGREGEVIIDRIKDPTKVIGMANGIGGVKDVTELSIEEKNKIREIQSFIESNK